MNEYGVSSNTSSPCILNSQSPSMDACWREKLALRFSLKLGIGMLSCAMTFSMNASHMLCTLTVASLCRTVFCRLKMASFPPRDPTVAGMSAAGLTVRLEPSTTHTSTFPACSYAALISRSGSCSPKLTMESSNTLRQLGSSQRRVVSWLNTPNASLVSKSLRYCTQIRRNMVVYAYSKKPRLSLFLDMV